MSKQLSPIFSENHVSYLVDALALGLDALMSDPAKRQELAQAAPQILNRFGLEQVMNMWSNRIEQAIDFHHHSSSNPSKV